MYDPLDEIQKQVVPQFGIRCLIPGPYIYYAIPSTFGKPHILSTHTTPLVINSPLFKEMI